MSSGLQSSRNCSRSAYALLAPAILVLSLFVIWPLVRAVIWGFTDASLLRPDTAAWTGVSNYGRLLGDPRFRRAFLNTSLFVLFTVPAQCALAFFLALWVNRPEREWRWLRAVFFVPVVVAMPVLAVLWTLLYQPVQGDQMGLINALMVRIGATPKAWLTNPQLALPAIAFMSIWQGVGFQMMIFLAGLQGIPSQQLEAAIMDGANAAQRLRYVIIPWMRNSILFVLTATTILAFRLFVQPYLMTRGGPDGRTLSVIQYLYETTFLEHDLASACAGAMLFLLVVGILTLIQQRMIREVRA